MPRKKLFITMLPSISARRTLPYIWVSYSAIDYIQSLTPALNSTVCRSIRSTKISSFVFRMPERESASCTGLFAEWLGVVFRFACYTTIEQ